MSSPATVPPVLMARAPSWKEQVHDDDHAEAEPGRERHGR